MTAVGAAAAAENNFTYYTEDMPPLNYLEKGVPKGLAVELLQEMWRRMGYQQKKIHVLPWQDAYNKAQGKPGGVVFSTMRLPEREKMFKWVGPIRNPRFSLFARKGRGIKVANLEEAKKYKVGAVKMDAMEILLVSRKYPLNLIDRAPDFNTLMDRLLAGKVDLIAYDEEAVVRYMQLRGLDHKEVERTLLLTGASAYFAFHPGTPDSVIAEFQGALQSIKKDGTFNKMSAKYNVQD
jgi:polar amino acid transport system substrate-binding protein